MGLSTAPSLFYFEVGFSWIITSPLLSPIITYTDGFFEGLSFQLAFASLCFWYASQRTKDRWIFHPCGFFLLSKDFTGCFIGGGKSIYLFMVWSYLWEFIHPYGACVVGFSLA